MANGTNTIIKEGYIELQTGSRWTKQFNKRYITVKRSGIINLYPPKNKQGKPKESFQLQGGEDIHSGKIHKNRYPIEIIIQGHKKQKKWTLGFQTAKAQQSWLNLFRSVLKHLKAAAHLQQVLTGSNIDTMYGQLLIASALAECGQIAKADRIYNKLIVNYGQEATEVHEQYEIFLSKHCDDIHQAEQHFLRRKRFFCLPREIIHTTMGEQLMKISQRVEFMSSGMAKSTPNMGIKLINIENMWPHYLYYVPTKHLKRARRYVIHFLRETHRNVSEYKYEYSYGDIEAKAWIIMQECVSGKNGAKKLEARLDIVMDSSAMKELMSQMHGKGIPNEVRRFLRETTYGNLDQKDNVENKNGNADNKDSFDVPQMESETAHLDGNTAIPLQPHRDDWMFPMSEESGTNLRSNSSTNARGRIRTVSSIVGSDAMDDILDIVDDFADIDIDSDSESDIKNEEKSSNVQNNFLSTTYNPFSIFSSKQDRPQRAATQRMGSQTPPVHQMSHSTDLPDRPGMVHAESEKPKRNTIMTHSRPTAPQRSTIMTYQQSAAPPKTKLTVTADRHARSATSTDEHLPSTHIKHAHSMPRPLKPNKLQFLANLATFSVPLDAEINASHSQEFIRSATFQQSYDTDHAPTVHKRKSREKRSRTSGVLEPMIDKQDSREFRSNTALQIMKKKSPTRDVMDVFSSVHCLIDDTAPYHIFPWTLFMLIWITRRDAMSHIVGNHQNVEQIQVILEFVYLFVRGSMIHFERYPEYALLLQTLYHLSTVADHEDVQYKMVLSGVRVMAEDEVTIGTKYEVCRFMRSQKWLDIKSEQKLATLRKYFVKGLREELQRIHDLLDKYYEMSMYPDIGYSYLQQISTSMNVITEISTQTHDKVQGQSTWGPRVDNKYSHQGFVLVCQHRKIAPIPRPVVCSGDFDECYMLFCIALAKKVNPYFQAQIQTALKGLDFEHEEETIKAVDVCYRLVNKELKSVASPKAARILDYCKCIVMFKNVGGLVKGFNAISDKFTICKIVNRFGRRSQNIDHYKFLNLYIICKHPHIRFVRLICEVRMVLDTVQQLYNERLLVKECFGNVVKLTQIKALMKEIAGSKMKQKFRKKLSRSATHR